MIKTILSAISALGPITSINIMRVDNRHVISITCPTDVDAASLAVALGIDPVEVKRHLGREWVGAKSYTPELSVYVDGPWTAVATGEVAS